MELGNQWSLVLVLLISNGTQSTYPDESMEKLYLVPIFHDTIEMLKYLVLTGSNMFSGVFGAAKYLCNYSFAFYCNFINIFSKKNEKHSLNTIKPLFVFIPIC